MGAAFPPPPFSAEREAAMATLISERTLWLIVHGIVLGSAFLLAFSAGLLGLVSYGWDTTWLHKDLHRFLHRLRHGIWITALLSWVIVLTGSGILGPWYYAAPPPGADLTDYPRAYLLSSPELRAWHTFGMEWKVNISWLTPVLTTSVAFIAFAYGRHLTHDRILRRVTIGLFTLAFLLTGIAAMLGVLVAKIAPLK
ncbi:hypothetical protein ARMA_0558 [Ardenticatena maritima]|uniref:Uncharacterized protein n=2 Tax=Ardenticatena maritima TaxID=872965 RepID=A0A0M8K5J7_9CHLR|nr:hypothetical protein ARMA_0558 [Ardenticatena maritima]